MNYTIIGGINGVGKSTVYSSLLDDDVITRRSITSFKTLKALIPLCDKVLAFDNIVAYNLVAKISHENIFILDKNIPYEIQDCFLKKGDKT